MELSLEYAAGLFDGEGCIGLYRNKGSADPRYKSGKRPPGWVRAVTINACYRPTLEAFAAKFGGKVSRHRSYAGHKTLWAWALGARRDIAAFLLALAPHLREKHAQAQLMLMELSGAASTEMVEAELKRLKKERT